MVKKHHLTSSANKCAMEKLCEQRCGIKKCMLNSEFVHDSCYRI